MSTIRLATCSLKSISAYSQSNYFTTERPTKMKADEFEELYWREKAHSFKAGPDAGKIFIPRQQFKNSLVDAAKYLGMKIKGKGMSTYSKNFAAGVMCNTDLVLPIKVEEVDCAVVMCNADGKTGSAAKVKRLFPIVHQWSGKVEFLLLDETIDDETFRIHLTHAGSIIGIGRWRPIKNGCHGRFMVEDITVAPMV